jgi:hypothetical protein
MKIQLWAFLCGFLLVSMVQAAGRDWAVDPTSLVNLILQDQYKPDSGPSEDRSGQTIVVSFGRNWGQYEAGPILTYDYFKTDSDKTTTTYYGAYFRYNFIENNPGTMLVPFAKVSYQMGDVKTDSNTTKAKILRIAAGATWFPVNDFVAIDGTLTYSDRQYSPDDGSDFKYTGLALNGAFVVYF